VDSLDQGQSGRQSRHGPAGNRWEWRSNDETSHLLKKLRNDELAIESTNLHRALDEGGEKKAAPATPRRATRPMKPGARDSGGGFNPYDHAGKKRR